MKLKNIKQRAVSRGFTLIELILYIALITIFISGAILFSWDIIYGRVKSHVQQEVNQNLRLASKRIIYEIRNASDINSVGSDTLCLTSSDASYNPVYFHLSSGQLYVGWGNGSTDCTSLSNDLALTSNLVTVSSLSFTDLTTAEDRSKNIHFSLTVESDADRSEWQRTQTYTTSVELRSN